MSTLRLTSLYGDPVEIPATFYGSENVKVRLPHSRWKIKGTRLWFEHEGKKVSLVVRERAGEIMKQLRPLQPPRPLLTAADIFDHMDELEDYNRRGHAVLCAMAQPDGMLEALAGTAGR